MFKCFHVFKEFLLDYLEIMVYKLVLSNSKYVIHIKVNIYQIKMFINSYFNFV